MEPIQAGDITVTFRHWSSPRVRVGGRYRFWGRGCLEVLSLGRLRLSEVAPRDLARAGLPDRDALGALTRDGTGGDDPELYRVEFRFLPGADERAILAAQARLSQDEAWTLLARLGRMDRARPSGPWTGEVLRLIAANPRVRAPELARRLGRETLPCKTDVRKLKALGLTLSHQVGYELSPRGRALLARMDARPESAGLAARP